MNILVTGGNGQLGRSLQTVIEPGEDRYIFTDVDTLDITDRNAVEEILDKEKIDIIVNCAAYTNVDAAEDDVDKARILNSGAPAILASEISARNGFLIHISTDYVFDGKGNTPITEDASISPIGVYGKTKADGERLISGITDQFIIIRTAWLYSEFGHNFVKTMLRLTDEKDELKVVSDQTGTPTYASDLAKTIVDIISSRKYSKYPGLYHFTNEGVCSWYDLAHEVNSIAGHDCKVNPCLTSEYPTKARRPAYSVLSKRKIKEIFSIDIPYWRDSLSSCISNIKQTNAE